MAGGLDPGQRAGAGEGSGHAPLDRAALVLGGRGDDLRPRVGDGLEQLAQKRAQPVGRGDVGLPAHVVVRPLGPQRDCGIEVARVERLKVASRGLLSLVARDAPPAFRHLLDVFRRLLDLRSCVAPLLLLGHARSFRRRRKALV